MAGLEPCLLNGHQSEDDAGPLAISLRKYFQSGAKMEVAARQGGQLWFLVKGDLDAPAI